MTDGSDDVASVREGGLTEGEISAERQETKLLAAERLQRKLEAIQAEVEALKVSAEAYLDDSQGGN
jgi:hypothetical protein